jgi:uroporphyrinogen-III synthase
MPQAIGVLVTRPQPGLDETMAAVAEMGFEPVACPMLEIRARAHILPAADPQAILITSRQAVAFLAEDADRNPALKQLPLFAVGDRTAACARAAGFTRVMSAAGNAHDLAVLVRARQSIGDALLLPTAEGQGAWLDRSLRQAGYTVHLQWIYSASPPPGMPAAGLAALEAGRLAAALFFSTETARNFMRLCPVRLHPSLHTVRALAISPSVGSALTGPWRSVEIAEHADAEAVLARLHHDDFTPGTLTTKGAQP